MNIQHKPISILYLNGIGQIIVNITLPNELTLNNFALLKQTKFKHKCEDGLLSIHLNNDINFSFQLTNNISIHNIKSVLPKIIHPNILQIKYQTQRNAINNEIIYNKLGNLNIRHLLCTSGDITSSYILKDIQCKECDNILFNNNNCNTQLKIVYDIDIKRLDNNIIEMFSCYEQYDIVNTFYNNIQHKLINKINIEHRYIWINYYLYKEYFNTDINTNSNSNNGIICCSKCKTPYGYIDNTTLPNNSYMKYDLLKIKFNAYNEASPLNTISITNIISPIYIDIIIHKALQDNQTEIIFTSPTTNSLIILKPTSNTILHMELSYTETSSSLVNICQYIEIIYTTTSHSHSPLLPPLNESYTFTLTPSDMTALTSILHLNAQLHYPKIYTYIISSNTLHMHKTYYYLEI